MTKDGAKKRHMSSTKLLNFSSNLIFTLRNSLIIYKNKKFQNNFLKFKTHKVRGVCCSLIKPRSEK